MLKEAVEEFFSTHEGIVKIPFHPINLFYLEIYAVVTKDKSETVLVPADGPPIRIPPLFPYEITLYLKAGNFLEDRGYLVPKKLFPLPSDYDQTLEKAFADLEVRRKYPRSIKKMAEENMQGIRNIEWGKSAATITFYNKWEADKFGRLETLPALPKEVGFVMAEAMTKLERFSFKNTIDNLAGNGKGKNIDGLQTFADGLAVELTVEEHMRSVPSYLAYRKDHLFLTPDPVLKNAPIEVVKLYCSQGHEFEEPTLREYGRYDIIKWQKERGGVWVASLTVPIPPAPDNIVVHPEVSAEAIDSVYRSTFSRRSNDAKVLYARHIAFALRIDAMKFITAERLDIYVGDMGLGPNTIEAMAWARRNGKDWRRPGATLNVDMYTSLEVIKWLDEHGCPWTYHDWWGVFSERFDTNFNVVNYLIEREVPITHLRPANVRDTIEQYYAAQIDRWKKQLSSLEHFNNVKTPHPFPTRLIMKAPTEVARLSITALNKRLTYNRYDLIDDLQNVHAVLLNAQQAKDLSADTLYNIYNAIRNKDCAEFIISLMSHGRTDVLEKIGPDDIIRRGITIFRGRYRNITDAERTCNWALRNGLPWGLRPVVDPLLYFFDLMGAPKS